MNIYKYDIMKFLLNKEYTSQRVIAEETGYSLGNVNNAIKDLIFNNYITDEFSLTKKSFAEFNDKKPKNAIILAAGFGMRMVPINNEVPKGLLEVQGEILIERLIRQLQEVDIREITIVVGFLKEKFEYLIDKYNVKLIYNPDYKLKNNIYSLKLVTDNFSNTYIIPSDVYAKNNPFSKTELYSWYSVSDELDDESTVRINRRRELIPAAKGGGGNYMTGIAYLLKEDSIILRNKIEELCKDKLNDELFWEEALFNKENKRPIYARQYISDELIEINTYEQLREIDEQSRTLESSIIDIIAKEMKVRVKDIEKIDILKKGMTNRSFQFTVKNKKYIMRIPGEGTDLLVNRKNEYEVYRAIKELEISDDIIYISPINGYKITAFIEDARVCNPYDKEDIKACMDKLRYFHNMKIKVDHNFDVYERIEFYESLWEGKHSIFKDYQTTKKKIMELKEIVKLLPKEIALSHIDPIADNFLFTENDAKLIDWEYAGMQDPHIDIAMFAIYAMYDRDQVDFLIDSYFINDYSKEIKIKIYSYIAICGLLWSNWCEYKRFCGVEFAEYSLRQYRYAKEFHKIVMDEYINGNN